MATGWRDYKTAYAGRPNTVVGDVQVLSTPGGQGMFSDPAVWHHGGGTTMFATTAGGTAAYVVRGGRLHLSWQNGTGGTSPVLAGGRLWVQDLDGGLNVYRPGSGRRVAHLATGPGHWQSPVLGGGRVLVAEGEAATAKDSRRSSRIAPINTAPR